MDFRLQGLHRRSGDDVDVMGLTSAAILILLTVSAVQESDVLVMPIYGPEMFAPYYGEWTNSDAEILRVERVEQDIHLTLVTGGIARIEHVAIFSSVEGHTPCSKPPRLMSEVFPWENDWRQLVDFCTGVFPMGEPTESGLLFGFMERDGNFFPRSNYIGWGFPVDGAFHQINLTDHNYAPTTEITWHRSGTDED